MNDIVTGLLYFNINLKIYHWQTECFSRHVSTDQLYNELEKKIDRFVEVLQGYRGRVIFNNLDGIQFKNYDENSGRDLLARFRDFLKTDVTKAIKNGETDLINLRDEMLEKINKCIYLFTLK